MSPERVSASPTKDFFISMITRDIALEDCILDLLDNSIDGARMALLTRGGEPGAKGRFTGFSASITARNDRFAIEDNCGGISIDQAKNYAFHFGRRRDAPPGAPETVGLYGIGMKRAMFKIGRTIIVRSSTERESFVVPIDVNAWAADENNWDFGLEPGAPLAVSGTTLEIVDLNEGVGEEFGDQVFLDRLVSIISRDYSFVLGEGFDVRVNNVRVAPFEFGWLVSNDFEPVRQTYVDRDVSVDIVAGVSRVPPDDDSPGDPERPETQYYGWFVVCNDRVVLAGNKTEATVWGDEGFPAWHPQYNGFTGIVHFRASNPKLLPWTTTKRGVDETAPVYRQAVSRMKEATRPFLDYTNARKQDLEEAKRREQAARLVTSPAPRTEMKVPVFTPLSAPRVKYASIGYSVPEREYLQVAKALGDPRMARKEVGLRTFGFFRERMVEAEV